jgi:2-polyprenyl-3-methyl-5-hydroxy-6-metoxy-1,4-benzoquinol methylase
VETKSPARPADPYVGASYTETWARQQSPTHHRLLDPASRRRKAEKILAVVADFVGRPLGDLRCLDVGCSTGGIAAVLAERFGEVVALDPDAPAIAQARATHRRPNLSFEAATLADVLPRLGPADVVVLNHVYEHVHDQPGLMAQVAEAVGARGCCYFSAGNALMLVEGHYSLPLLSWLPERAASAYVRLLGRGDRYRERHLTLWGLRRLVRAFRIRDYTLPILADPTRFGAEEFSSRLLPPPALAAAARVAYPLIPTYVWMLTRRPAAAAQPVGTAP